MRVHPPTLLILSIAALALMTERGAATELSACESEREKMTQTLGAVFKPYLRKHESLASQRGNIIDLKVSLNGWVEDIAQCYRNVYAERGAPEDDNVLNNGLHWSGTLTEFHELVKILNRQIQTEAQKKAESLSEKDPAFRHLLQQVLLPNFPLQAERSGGEFI
ncbi:hypothetical protein ONV78_18880 [Hahella sp. CR1]|uniref:hypothetical protein n=1 Tax=Hahella sp. CR1 TaxID=2992807 RepID=UPI0024415328|nr:hypothetical protein [Hahella sp. CR1]MDG9669808.1 hypothetical protein [Hahella sp. CR1]